MIRNKLVKCENIKCDKTEILCKLCNSYMIARKKMIENF